MTLMRNNRVFEYDGSTLHDRSRGANDYLSTGGGIGTLTSSSYVYIGAPIPFNHRHFLVSTANTNASTLTVELWDGTAWQGVVDLVDGTLNQAGSTTFSQSGVISWELDKNKNWLKEDTDKMTGSGLESVVVYDLYWARLSVSADHSASTSVDFVGWKFADDDDFGAQYPDLNTSGAKGQFESGKTTWDDQHFAAAEYIVKDLTMRRDGDFFSPNQIIRWDLFTNASVHRVAELIYNSYGPDGVAQRDDARTKFSEQMNLALAQLDLNRNTRLDVHESIQTFEVIRR